MEVMPRENWAARRKDWAAELTARRVEELTTLAGSAVRAPVQGDLVLLGVLAGSLVTSVEQEQGAVPERRVQIPLSEMMMGTVPPEGEEMPITIAVPEGFCFGNFVDAPSNLNMRPKSLLPPEVAARLGSRVS